MSRQRVQPVWRLREWVQIPALVTADGRVIWSTTHLTLFSVLRLRTVTYSLLPALNPITFTGATGTTPASIASEIGPAVESVVRFDVPLQSYQVYVPGAPALVNTLVTLTQRDPLFIRVAPGTPTLKWVETDILPRPSGSRSVQLLPGLNPIGFTGQDGTHIAALLAPVQATVISASRFRSATQAWDTYVPGAPALVNTLGLLNRLDVVYIALSGSASVTLQLPEGAAGDPPLPGLSTPPPASSALPTPAPTTEISQTVRSVEVRFGDTLRLIGSRYGVDWRVIAGFNEIAGPDYYVFPTQVLQVPQGFRTVVVQDGDTLTAIARRYDADPFDLAALNGVAGPDFAVLLGRVLWLPDAGQTVVRPGENLILVGKRLGIDWLEIAGLNGIAGPVYVVYPGQALDIS